MNKFVSLPLTVLCLWWSFFLCLWWNCHDDDDDALFDSGVSLFFLRFLQLHRLGVCSGISVYYHTRVKQVHLLVMMMMILRQKGGLSLNKTRVNFCLSALIVLIFVPFSVKRLCTEIAWHVCVSFYNVLLVKSCVFLFVSVDFCMKTKKESKEWFSRSIRRSSLSVVIFHRSNKIFQVRSRSDTQMLSNGMFLYAFFFFFSFSLMPPHASSSTMPLLQ